MYPPVADLTGAQLAAYRAQLTNNSLAPASQSQALAALRAFLHWSGTMGAHRLSGDVIRAALKTPRGSTKKPYQVLSEPEGAALLAAVTTSRDLALLAVMLGAGLRAAEAVGLDIGDVLAAPGRGRRAARAPGQRAEGPDRADPGRRRPCHPCLPNRHSPASR